jgi:sugar phosphate isomerase/epimerase
MKLGVSSYSFSKYMAETKCGYEAICDIAKEIGFDGIEFINLKNEKWGELDDEFAIAQRIKNHCEKIGLEIIAYTVGANFLAEDVEKEMAALKHHVDVAAALGAPTMRHDVVYKLKDVPFYTYKTAISEIAPLVNEISDYALEKGIKTCTENHGYIFQSPERVEELILAVNNPNYGWLCDMGNFLCVDAEPARSVAVAAPYTVHVHAKDFLFKSGNEPKPEGFGITTTNGNYLRGTVVGHGVVPVKQCVNVLKKAGYNGWISLEFEGAEDNIQALKNGFANLKQLI